MRGPKFTCRDCETMTQPPMPSLPIERGLARSAACSPMSWSRSMPIIFRCIGRAKFTLVPASIIDRSTMAEWVGRMTVAAGAAGPRDQSSARARGEAVHADDTPVPVLDPGRRQNEDRTIMGCGARRATMGIGGAALPCFTDTHRTEKRSRPKPCSRNCRGYLHADAYTGFNGLYEPDAITGKARLVEVACWAHARRKIFEVHSATGSHTAMDFLRYRRRCSCWSSVSTGNRRKSVLPPARNTRSLCSTRSRRIFETTLAKISRKTSLAQAHPLRLTRGGPH